MGMLHICLHMLFYIALMSYKTRCIGILRAVLPQALSAGRVAAVVSLVWEG